MTALFLGVGWKILAGAGAVAAAALAWMLSLHNAKSQGVADQQAADTKKREADLEKASGAAGAVNSLDDDAVLRELHRDYDRKPM